MSTSPTLEEAANNRAQENEVVEKDDVHDLLDDSFLTFSAYHYERTRPGTKPLFDTEELMDGLTRMSPEEIFKLRHIAVQVFPFPVYLKEGAGHFCTYMFQDVLHLFPTLQLELFEVHDMFSGRNMGADATYSSIIEFVREGRGWKETIFHSDNIEWFRPICVWNVPREPQPSTWDRMIKERNGRDSGVKVELFMKTGASTDKKAELTANQEMACKLGLDISSRAAGWGVNEVGHDGDDGLMGKGWQKVEIYKADDTIDTDDDKVEIAVRIRRGEGVDYTQGVWEDRGSRKDRWKRDLQQLFKEYTWPVMKQKGLYRLYADDAADDLL